MPYRKLLEDSNTQDPQRLLSIWREERAYRIGKILVFGGLFLAGIATVTDFFLSSQSVFITDLVLLFGCFISLAWLKSSKRPHYFWIPTYIGFWISVLPSLWTTGGIASAFLGVDMAALYVVGATMDSKNSSVRYIAFALLHLPVLYILEKQYSLSATPPPPHELVVIISGVTLGSIFLCIHALLRTEKELALEFSEHYRSVSRTKEVLKKQEAQLREAQSIAEMGSWEWDLKADRISWSDELFNIFEVSKESFDPSFKAYLARLNPEISERINETILHSLSTGEDYIFENVIKTSQGDRYVLSRGRVQKDAHGQIEKMLGTSQDITDRKNIEAQLVRARDELEKRVEERTLQLEQSLEREKAAKESAENASQAKMQFLANMSHEIRTPMNSILGFSELLAGQSVSASDAKEYVERIRGNGAHLLRLIDDILDLSKFEAGKIPIHRSAISIGELIDNVVHGLRPLAHAKKLLLDVEYNSSSDFEILTDTHRLRQILNNLLSNAIKFSNHGIIRIVMEATPLNEIGRYRLRIDVYDNGIGISEENQKNLFQPFSQGDSSIARKYGGSGLGLVLSRRIAEALGGTLELKSSQPDQGSHFQVDIPVEVAAKGTDVKPEKKINLRKPEAGQFQGKSILVVEDSPDNAILIRHYIQFLGVSIDVARDGLQAVEMAKQKKYDCILMDIQMPGMDGLEATRRIRSSGFKNPIIALTAHALQSETQKSIAAGCNLHLTKPINRADLIGALSEQLTSYLKT